MINNLVIVGNGLDLHHGIKSKYEEFYNSGKMPEYLKDVYNILTEKNDAACTWYDFEEEYRSLVSNEMQFMYAGYYGSNLGLSDDNKKKLIPRIELINYIFQIVNRCFIDYLHAEYDNAQTNLLFKVDPVVLDGLNKADVILNFNYTETVKELYGVDNNKNIHVHGKLNDHAILGHSNYCDYDVATGLSDNYGMHMNIPGLKETTYRGDKTIQRIENWNGIVQCSGEVSRNITINSGNISTVKIISNESHISMNMLDYMYDHPFKPFVDEKNGYHYANRLALDFADKIRVTVVGHGMQSDIDLLSKLPTKVDELVVLQRNKEDVEIVRRARRVFNPDFTTCRFYSWE